MDISDYVFHFSSAKVLLSIVTERELWATDVNYLNDKTEGKRGIIGLTQIINNPGLYLPGVDTCPKHLQALEHSLTHGLVMHTVSFSERYNFLPQYQMYCPPDGGYAIGFHKAYLAEIGQFVKCDYSQENATRWHQEYAKEFLTAAAELDDGVMSAADLDARVRSKKNYITERVITSLTFKPNEFAHEMEYRLIIPGKPNVPGLPNRKYRESRSRNALIPYRIVDLHNDPIEVCIAAGPNRDPEYAGSTVGSLISAANGAGTKWRFSQLGTGVSGLRM